MAFRAPLSSSRTMLGAAYLLIIAALLPGGARAQQLQGRRLPDIYINVEFHDGYWEWYAQYLRDRQDARARITEIRLQLAVIAKERKSLRAEWLRLLYEENRLTPRVDYDAAWGPFWTAAATAAGASTMPLTDEATGVSSASTLADELRQEMDDIRFRWSAGFWGAPLVVEETDPSGLEAAYGQRRDELRSEINTWKERQEALIREAIGLNRDLSSSCLFQKEKSGERRPWLNAETTRLDDDVTILEIQLYDAAQWYLPDELPQLIDALDLDNTATEEVAALLRAKVALHQAEWNDEKNFLQLTSPRQAPPDPAWVLAARAPRLEAIVHLRRVLELNPDNPEARGLLAEAELYWLREIAAKVDLESRASLKAFQQYLTARGFYADQPQGWTQDAFEVISTLWGLGPIALVSGLPGVNVAAARATELDVTQTAAARNQVSLLAMMRLVKNGVPLAEIPTMSPDEVGRRMTMHTADGRPLPAAQASRVVQDMRDTFRDLDDLRLLASADPQYLVEDVNRAFGTIYYAPLDPTYTWYESFGDLINLHNLTLLWGPGSIVKIDGKWATTGLMSATELQAMEQAGVVLTGRQAFLSGLRLDKLAETIAGTRIGARFASALAADRAAMTAQGPVMALANMGVRLASALVLYSGATYLGQEAGIPGIGLLVEIVGELGPVDMLSDVATRAQVPLEELGTRLDDFAEFLAKESDDLASTRQLLDEVSELTEELAETADPSRQAAIQSRAGEIVEQLEELAETRTGGSIVEPVDEATGAAATALRNGDVVEAQQAVTRGGEIAEETATHLDEVTNKVTAAAAKLNGAAQAAPPMRVIPPDQAKTIRQLYGEGLPESFWRTDLYGHGEIGRNLQLGDEFLRKGELEKAQQQYETVERLINETGLDPRYSVHRELAQERFALAVNAKALRDDIEALRSHTPPSNASVAIDESTAAQVLDNFDDLPPNTAPIGSANDVFLVHDNDGNAYYVKKIAAGRAAPEEIELILSSEAASSGLARRLDELEREAAGAGYEHMGLSAPAMHYDKDRQLLITRAIPNASEKAGELVGKPEFVVLALKQEYAKQRLFRAWLGDADGHLRNMIIGDDGRVYMIDFDMATLSGIDSRQIRHDPMRTEGEVIRDTIVFWADFPTSDSRYAMYKWMARLDQTISYDDVRPTIAAIQELANNPAELREILEAARFPDVEGAVESLTQRAGEIDRVARELFDGGLLNRVPATTRDFDQIPPAGHPLPVAGPWPACLDREWAKAVHALRRRPDDLARAA